MSGFKISTPIVSTPINTLIEVSKTDVIQIEVVKVEVININLWDFINHAYHTQPVLKGIRGESVTLSDTSLIPFNSSTDLKIINK